MNDEMMISTVKLLLVPSDVLTSDKIVVNP